MRPITSATQYEMILAVTLLRSILTLGYSHQYRSQSLGIQNAGVQNTHKSNRYEVIERQIPGFRLRIIPGSSQQTRTNGLRHFQNVRMQEFNPTAATTHPEPQQVRNTDIAISIPEVEQRERTRQYLPQSLNQIGNGLTSSHNNTIGNNVSNSHNTRSMNQIGNSLEGSSMSRIGNYIYSTSGNPISFYRSHNGNQIPKNRIPESGPINDQGYASSHQNEERTRVIGQPRFREEIPAAVYLDTTGNRHPEANNIQLGAPNVNKNQNRMGRNLVDRSPPGMPMDSFPSDTIVPPAENPPTQQENMPSPISYDNEDSQSSLPSGTDRSFNRIGNHLVRSDRNIIGKQIESSQSNSVGNYLTRSSGNQIGNQLIDSYGNRIGNELYESSGNLIGNGMFGSNFNDIGNELSGATKDPNENHTFQDMEQDYDYSNLNPPPSAFQTRTGDSALGPGHDRNNYIYPMNPLAAGNGFTNIANGPAEQRPPLYQILYNPNWGQVQTHRPNNDQSYLPTGQYPSQNLWNFNTGGLSGFSGNIIIG